MFLKLIAAFLINIIIIPSVLAQQYGWGTTIKDEKGKVKIGGRLQTILAQDSETGAQDFYLRRTRLNLEYKPWAGHTFVYDIRNDGANENDKGEQTFNIGDAYWKIDINENTINNIKLFRAKVDVSYSQQSSSRNLFNPQRAEISEHASDFVVHNRRAVNAQLNGNLGKLAYQVVISDGVNSSDLSALKGENIAKVNYQKLTYGSKIRYFFFGDAKKNKSQDTFYGEHDTFSLGLGYFLNDKINVDNSSNGTGLSEFSFNRKLTNIDLSYSYKGFRLLAEYFELSGDLINLEATSKDNIIGNSGGYYAQIEYAFNKWSPYIIYESFDKNRSSDDAVQNITTVGLNFYQRLEATRFGVAHKTTVNGKSIGDDTAESLYLYAMLNF
jgi:hypothetical protein